ncbi:hypothetical protein QYF61_027219 [Mycteria americana]|uniref:Uncharacterized protein n=1 Tax=Mycteria americana TaxID=33587 RepID=A0AAN7SHM4_MYCAM|nr:hypothetical protein QYF61_027219 [Mycteria americana]
MMVTGPEDRLGSLGRICWEPATTWSYKDGVIKPFSAVADDIEGTMAQNCPLEGSNWSLEKCCSLEEQCSTGRVAQGDGEWGLRSVHHTLSVPLLPPQGEDSSHSSPAPAWGPSHRRQSSTNFSSVPPSHRL